MRNEYAKMVRVCLAVRLLVAGEAGLTRELDGECVGTVRGCLSARLLAAGEAGLTRELDGECMKR